MSNRDYAITLVKSLTDEQIDTIIEILDKMVDRATIAKLESMALAGTPHPKLYDNFEEALKDMELEDE